MTFIRNLEREKKLLERWRYGNTIKKAALLTNIPEGTISHYFKRYNKNPEKYKKIIENKYQDLPKADTQEAIQSNFNRRIVLDMISPLIQKGDFAKVRDFLQMFELIERYEKKHISILQNVDKIKYQQKANDIIKQIFTYIGKEDTNQK